MTAIAAPTQAGTLSISRRALTTLIAQALPATPTRTTLPIIGSLLFEAASDGLTLTATDLDMAVRVRAAADVQVSDGDALLFALPARSIAQIVRDLDADTVTFLVNGPQVTVKGGRARFKLASMDAREFPAFPAVAFDGAVTLPAKALLTLANMTRYAASRDESRPILGGVLVEAHAHGLRMVATDGHRMAIATATAISAPGLPTSIVPPGAFDALAKLLASGGTVSVASTGNQLAIRADETGAVLTTRLIEGPYPNYQQVIPTAPVTDVAADTAALVAVLRRAGIVATGSTTNRIVLSVRAREIGVSAATADLGEMTDLIAATTEGDEMKIGFNVHYLLEALKTIATPEVRLRLTTPERAALIVPQGGSGGSIGEVTLTTLVMPLRILD